MVAQKPDGILTTFGGQNALNMGYCLEQTGMLDQYQVALAGLTPGTIEITEDRAKFREFLADLGFKLPAGYIVTNINDGIQAAEIIGFPVVVRASLAAEGGGVQIAFNKEELEEFIARA